MFLRQANPLPFFVFRDIIRILTIYKKQNNYFFN